MESLHLTGSEAVGRAAGNIFAAANTMSRAADTLDSAMAHTMEFMNEWIQRFEIAVEKLEAVEKNRLPEGWRVW